MLQHFFASAGLCKPWWLINNERGLTVIQNLKRAPYICGGLTGLREGIKKSAKVFYERVAEALEDITGQRPFVPHKHYDPEEHKDFTPAQVDAAERQQVCCHTSVVIAVTLAPSWGGGIEVEMANHAGVPVILLCQEYMLDQRLISRLLRGNPAVKMVILYANESQAIAKLLLAREEINALINHNNAVVI
ncbi:MAG: hypothetical protein A3D44_03815 [Candidatus Staskawiczbacteria bacterium RIFCSPHIGHO2_02_FULL_42_22]|uniref:Uncharacterized protein n=1 Tax=Candidatus Staskawiczbacteria bacterium RIFCSPHIGHO2_02_FULL_42_22 TaxID=1802207 RepID=A0A1G2I3X2_9BACT|nr:MAG: hypothetical protein A3D44_03815 [Candidatus Staskawiczbacteria bacterium RIFCSPHIGHO2_02_FULL_42_22]